MQFHGEAPSFSAGSSIMSRGILLPFWSLADTTDWVLSFLHMNGKDKSNHVALLHPDPPGNPPFILKKASSSSTPIDN